MAASVVTVTPNLTKFDVSERWAFDHGALAVAAGDYTNGTGLVVDLTQACRSAALPVRVEVWSETSGYTYRFNIGTTKANGHLRIFSGGTEASTAATPAGVVADVIYYRITRRKS